MGSKSPDKDLKRAFELAQKAITLNESFGIPHSILGNIYLANRQYEKAVEEADKAVALSPNDADARIQMANIYNLVGRREEAIRLANQAIRLNPFPQSYYFGFLGEALCLAGHYEEAIKAYEKANHLSPTGTYEHPVRIVPYCLSGREEETNTVAEAILIRYPKFKVKNWEMTSLYKNQTDTAFIADAMRKAGLPD